MPEDYDTNNPHFWEQRALTHSRDYLRAQAAVDRVEDQVLKESGNRQIMKAKLRDHYDTRTGRMYTQLCDARDIYMAVASNAALMAIMLRSRQS